MRRARRVKRAVSIGSSVQGSVTTGDEQGSMSWENTSDAGGSLALEHSCPSLCCGDGSAYGDSYTDLKDLERLCDEFEKGVKMKYRKKYRLQRKGCPVFSGSDAVSFLVDNGHANSRRSAVRLARRMTYEFALFRHETNDYDLEDEKNRYYVFTSPDQRPDSSSKPRDSSLSLHAIADVFEEGVVVQTHVYKNRSYKNTFVGSAAVTFLVTSQIAKTRQDAVRIGQLLMKKNVFEHISRKHQFKDKPLLYRFVPRKQRVRDDKDHSSRDAVPIEATAQIVRGILKRGTSFSGTSAVDAMVNAGLTSSRSEAVMLGEKLASDLQLFHCIQDRGRTFYDRPDVFYEFRDGRKLATSLQNLDDKDAEGGQQYNGDSLEYGLVEELELVVGINKQEEGSNINSLPDTDFYDNDGHINLEDLVVNGETSEKSLLGDAVEESPGEMRCFDRFGFIVDNDEDALTDVESLKTYDCGDTIATTEKELSFGEWRVLLDRCAVTESGESPAASRNTVKHFMRIGLPDSLRRRAWTTITGVDAMVQEREGDYDSLVETATRLMDDRSEDLRDVIERDLHRTFPRHALFCTDGGRGPNPPPSSGGDATKENSASGKIIPDGIVSLRRVLYAYSIYDNEVGYCQGMNFIAAMFLTFLSEEESFWLLAGEFVHLLGSFNAHNLVCLIIDSTAVMKEEPYAMRDLFVTDMAGVHETLYVSEKLFRKFLPRLMQHFDNQNINIGMFVTQWFMTVFTSTFPFDLVARVWDSFLVEGWKVVYRVMLSLLENTQSDLSGLDMEGILTFVRDELASKVDGPSVVKASLKIPLRNKQIQKYRSEWRDSQGGGKKFRRKLFVHKESQGSEQSN
ncbi:hypothetical protein ACHAWF_016132 [Thalassiosira exigua]